jgi:hypothetical protein
MKKLQDSVVELDAEAEKLNSEWETAAENLAEAGEE